MDGKRVNLRSGQVYLAMNKPRGVLTAMSDPHGRPTVGDLVADQPERLFHVGRLDADTEGLLILTNDGEFAHRLAHPSYEVVKTYIAEVPGPVDRSLARRLKAGIELDDGPVRVDDFQVIGYSAGRALVAGVAARGPQPHRPAAAGGGRAPGGQAGADRDRPGPAGRPAAGIGAGVDRRRAG